MSADERTRRSVQRGFPELTKTPFQITSPATKSYNCIAWAADDDKRWWWPFNYYWPGLQQLDASVAVFTSGFEALGYFPCEERAFEPGFKKVALYADNFGQVLHAARQLEDGAWTSKLGEGVDITHQLEGLEGQNYGRVVLILRRQTT